MNQIDKTSPGDLGDQAALVGRHEPIQYFFGQLSGVFGRLADGAGFKGGSGVIFDGLLYLLRDCTTTAAPTVRNSLSERLDGRI